MSRSAQALTIDPSHELIFKGPFNDVVTCTMRLTNPTDRIICFKVKTTAPKQYCVRPNSGFLSPGEVCIVSVMLQPFDPSGNVEMDHTKHKFMVQSVYAPRGNYKLDDIWKNAQPSELMDSKLKVILEDASTADHERGKMPSRISPDTKTVTTEQTVSSSKKQQDLNDLNVWKPRTMDAEVLVANETGGKGEAAKATLEKDNNNLKAQLAALKAVPQTLGNQTSEGGIALLQVVLIAFAALMVGLIFGKLF